MAANTLKLATQFWTSRGFAVLDVNYGGSTGFGRAYRELLSGQWGIVDVEDCIAGARHLVDAGPGRRRAPGHPRRQRRRLHDAGARSPSTTCSRPAPATTASADLRALDADTHKFESRYTTDLLAPMPERERLYLRALADPCGRPPVVPGDLLPGPRRQGGAARAVRADGGGAARAGIPVAYLAFAGEGHGFRRKETMQRALEAELSFYAQVFGFEPGDEIERVALG